MAFVTHRPQFSNNAICYQCHGQALAFLTKRRAEFIEAKQEGFYRLDCIVPLCQICKDARCDSHPIVPWILRRRPFMRFQLMVTVAEMKACYSGATTSGLTENPHRVGVSANQLCTRSLKVTTTDKPLSMAFLEIMPWVSMCLASTNSFQREWTCCRAITCWNPSLHQVSRTYVSLPTIQSPSTRDTLSGAAVPATSSSASGGSTATTFSASLSSRSSPIGSNPSQTGTGPQPTTLSALEGPTTTPSPDSMTQTVESFLEEETEATGSSRTIQPLSRATPPENELGRLSSTDSTQSPKQPSLPTGSTEVSEETPAASFSSGVTPSPTPPSGVTSASAMTSSVSSSTTPTFTMPWSEVVFTTTSQLRSTNSQQRLLPVVLPSQSSTEVCAGSDGVPYAQPWVKIPEMVYEYEDLRVFRVCPAVQDRLFHKNCEENVVNAIKDRLTERKGKGALKCNLNKKERLELRTITDNLISRYFKKEDVHSVAKWLVDDVYKSKKWTPARFDAAMRNAFARYIPNEEIKHSGAIKLEPMKEGKACRLLVADGDVGQLCNFLLLGVFERRLFSIYKYMSIKGTDKESAMARVIEHLQIPSKSGVALIEADGSAFDMSVKLAVRELVENRVLSHIQDCLEDLLVAGTISKAEVAARTRVLDKFVIQVCPNKGVTATDEHLLLDSARKSLKKVIPSIRKSGERGTSSLNWLTSYVCSCWVYFGPRGVKMIDNQSTQCVDVMNISRITKWAFEGDDTAISMFPKPDDKALATYAARWLRLGFDMKMFCRSAGEACEFTGWKFIQGESGPLLTSAVPDLPRQLSHCPYSTSSTLVSAHKKGDDAIVAGIAAASLISCAYQLSNKAPTVANALYRWSSEWGAPNTLDHDFMMKYAPEAFESMTPEGWEEGPIVTQKQLDKVVRPHRPIACIVEERIASSMALQLSGGMRESTFALQHGWCDSEEEWDSFLAGLPAISVASSDFDIRRIAPKRFRGAFH